MSNDKSNLEVANFFKQAQEITAEACEVSIATVRRITSEASKFKRRNFDTNNTDNQSR